jgi:hypothetical protein
VSEVWWVKFFGAQNEGWGDMSCLYEVWGENLTIFSCTADKHSWSSCIAYRLISYRLNFHPIVVFNIKNQVGLLTDKVCWFEE